MKKVIILLTKIIIILIKNIIQLLQQLIKNTMQNNMSYQKKKKYFNKMSIKAMYLIIKLNKNINLTVQLQAIIAIILNHKLAKTNYGVK